MVAVRIGKVHKDSVEIWGFSWSWMLERKKVR